MRVLVEDSIYQFHVIDLSEYAEVKIPKECHSWAKDGSYYAVSVRKHGEKKFTKYNIDSEIVEKYQLCVRKGIKPEDYDTFLNLQKIIEG